MTKINIVSGLQLVTVSIRSLDNIGDNLTVLTLCQRYMTSFMGCSSHGLGPGG